MNLFPDTIVLDSRHPLNVAHSPGPTGLKSYISYDSERRGELGGARLRGLRVDPRNLNQVILAEGKG